MLIIGPDIKEINQLKKDLNTLYPCTDLGPVSYFLGIKVYRDRSTRSITLSQHGYIEKILHDFRMDQAHPAKTPMEKVDILPAEGDYKASKELVHEYAQLIGSLLWAAMQTRPDIAFATNRLSRYMANPTPDHLKAAKRVLRYLRGRSDLGITYNFQDRDGGDIDLQAYTDSDWAGDTASRKSTSGYVTMIGGGPISWRSGLQSTIAQSSCEAEYYGLGDCLKEVLWIQSILSEIGYRGDDLRPMLIHEDNQSAIDLAHNPQYHKRTKHVAIKHHFVRQHVEDGDVVIRYKPTNEMVADGLTKPLDATKHQAFLDQMNMGIT